MSKEELKTQIDKVLTGTVGELGALEEEDGGGKWG